MRLSRSEEQPQPRGIPWLPISNTPGKMFRLRPGYQEFQSLIHLAGYKCLLPKAAHRAGSLERELKQTEEN